MKWLLTVIVGLMLLPGCVPDTCQTCWWLCKPVCMSQPCVNLRHIIKKYHRAIRQYDQISTVLLCDALWLSPEVIDAYRQLAGRRLDHDLVDQKIKEDVLNETTVGFYVLISPLYYYGWWASNDAPCSYWSFVLRVNGNEYKPTIVEETCLPAEYDCLMAMCTNRFRTIYYVGFDAHEDGRSLVANARDFQLLVRSCAYQGCMQFTV